MYSTVIEIKKSVTGDALKRLCQMAENAFTNRAGSIKNSSKDPHKLVFEGSEKDYGCLDLGVVNLGDADGFLGQVNSWQWIDEEDPGESCDVLEAFAMPVR